MNLRSLAVDWLKDNRYDGLFNEDGECACKIDDLMPCGEPSPACRPGYEEPCDETCGFGGDCGFHIVDRKPDDSDMGEMITALKKILGYYPFGMANNPCYANEFSIQEFEKKYNMTLHEAAKHLLGITLEGEWR